VNVNCEVLAKARETHNLMEEKVHTYIHKYPMDRLFNITSCNEVPGKWNSPAE